MNFSENFETVKSFARSTASTAAERAKTLASIAKANVSVYAEQDKIRKAELELGKLFYRDYAAGSEADMAEYLPWCQKIDESGRQIAELKAVIAELRERDEEKQPAEEQKVEPECEIVITPEEAEEE